MVDGPRKERDIRVYALSTCGFCKRALAFLAANGFAHRYVHMDSLDLDLKNAIKAELKAKFKESVSYPFAVIDGKEVLVGFIEADWRMTLLGEGKA